MRLLYLHDGNYDVISIALKRGFEVVSFNIEDFNHSWYPFNYFDILWVNLSNKMSRTLNTEHSENVIVDILYFYEFLFFLWGYPRLTNKYILTF